MDHGPYEVDLCSGEEDEPLLQVFTHWPKMSWNVKNWFSMVLESGGVREFWVLAILWVLGTMSLCFV